ncbi:transcription factor bHLH143 isoform X1 [Hevea brasiliensis]|uniref:transcription factor bHLH143 isoform X1 n=1 Tax=Hevea brasiliensis TaxID=3981 RepID=UPI0025D27A54|nr:transcription factor bHLH143 isoform X1 [Hevea brasiliensis]
MLSTIARLPGNSFGYMVKANLFPPHCTWQSPNFNCMSTSVDPVEPVCLPACVNPGSYTFSANMMMPGIAVPCIPGLKTQQSNRAQGLPQSLRPVFQNLLPAVKPYLKENLSVFPYGCAGEVVPNQIPGCRRRFVIFDQSGNETSLIYSSFFPTDVKPTIVARKCIGDSYLQDEEHAAKMDQINQTVLKLQEVSDENHLSGEESEMHEDTEEINALLYLDDDGDNDDYDDDDNSSGDEVTSTGHSPIQVRSCQTRVEVEEITEEVAGSDGQSKRQKLLDGVYKRTSLADTASLTKVAGVHGCDDNDDESSYAIGQNQEEERLAFWGSKQLKKDKVRATLKILESIIPGAKDKDPLVVLDVAIDYLKSLKFEAKTLGANYC